MKFPTYSLGLLCLLFCCTKVAAQNFTEVASSLGVDHGYGLGTHGGGVSFADFNRDGLDDLTFTSGAGKPLYTFRNNGNGSFTRLFLVDFTLETKDATWVDYDNDGDRDLFVTAYDGRDRLYRNEGNLNMVDVTQSALGGTPMQASFGAVWGDYDNDGHLDLYVCHYNLPGSGLENDLYHNNGNGTFTKVTASSGVGNDQLLTFDACFVDLDENGWQDLYVINDKFDQPNALYMNTNGSFTPNPSSGAFISIDAMNAGGCDYDDDGDYDLYVTNTGSGNQLLDNDGSANFFDIAAATGTGVYRVCWGANFFDYDLDTDQDLYVAVIGSPSFNIPSAFLVNLSELGSPIFSEPFQFSGGLGGIDVGRSYGMAVGDYNNDGLPDLAVNRQLFDSSFVWRNDETTPHNWLKVDLFGTISNTEGIGARVEIDINGTTLTRYRQGGQGYLSQNSHQLHFGLGSAFQVDQLRVYWPSGIIDVYNNLTSFNQVFSITEGDAPLPAEILDFTAQIQERAVNLSWRVTNEIYVSLYQIQTSINGIDFTHIHDLPATHTQSPIKQYNWQDPSTIPFPRYYRLKIIDIDGTHTYSPILFLDRSPQSLQIGLPSPNPATTRVALPVYTPEPMQLLLKIHTPLGQQLFEFPYQSVPGQNIIPIDFQNFSINSSQLLISIFQNSTLIGTSTISIKKP
ncbi:MAG: CRTAC1 family protein [Bacteroidota bacterium]